MCMVLPRAQVILNFTSPLPPPTITDHLCPNMVIRERGSKIRKESMFFARLLCFPKLVLIYEFCVEPWGVGASQLGTRCGHPREPLATNKNAVQLREFSATYKLPHAYPDFFESKLVRSPSKKGARDHGVGRSLVR